MTSNHALVHSLTHSLTQSHSVSVWSVEKPAELLLQENEQHGHWSSMGTGAAWALEPQQQQQQQGTKARVVQAGMAAAGQHPCCTAESVTIPTESLRRQ